MLSSCQLSTDNCDIPTSFQNKQPKNNSAKVNKTLSNH
ncbi:MAG: hypothetical protein OFPI_14200 [Osedax symbiont Rs2]|nr:MAG: hypothetical protein OFPI_14200 [Osedax symbiont Rs2]